MGDESCGQCVPCRVGTVRQVELLQRLTAVRPSTGRRTRRLASVDRAWPGDARRVDLRPRPDGIVGDRVCGVATARVPDAVAWRRRGVTSRHERRSGFDLPLRPVRRSSHSRRRSRRASRSSSSIDGEAVQVAAGATILDACRAAGKDIPTLCYLETLTPINACRVCVVEVGGCARAGAGVFAQGRSGDEGSHQLAAGADVASRGARVAGFVRRSVHRRRAAGAPPRVRR